MDPENDNGLENVTISAGDREKDEDDKDSSHLERYVGIIFIPYICIDINQNNYFKQSNQIFSPK